jgi:superoxide dismutase, Fe-Mn family
MRLKIQTMKKSFILFGTLLSALLLPLTSHSEPTAVTKETRNLPGYTLSALPYAYEALEPVIDRETMKIHHQKHHQAYVNNLNKAIVGTPAAKLPIQSLLAEISKWPATVRNNAGGHWNHQFYWESLLPPAQFKAPSSALKQAIDTEFGSMEAFQKAFEAAGAGHFGSGWVWLIKKQDGHLTITSTPNQDNPLMDIADIQGTPLLGWDVWEHAYYLKYQNQRAEYLKAMWQLVNWQTVLERYQRK